MIGRNIAPGLKRRFAAEDWPTVSASLWQAAREEARDLIRPELSERIIGTDLDEPVLSQARYHAQLAGVDEDIHFQQRKLKNLETVKQASVRKITKKRGKSSQLCLVGETISSGFTFSSNSWPDMYHSFSMVSRNVELSACAFFATSAALS